MGLTHVAKQKAVAVVVVSFYFLIRFGTALQRALCINILACLSSEAQQCLFVLVEIVHLSFQDSRILDKFRHFDVFQTPESLQGDFDDTVS